MVAPTLLLMVVLVVAVTVALVTAGPPINDCFGSYRGCIRKHCRHARVPPDQTVDQLLGSSNLCWRNCLRDVQVSCAEMT